MIFKRKRPALVNFPKQTPTLKNKKIRFFKEKERIYIKIIVQKAKAIKILQKVLASYVRSHQHDFFAHVIHPILDHAENVGLIRPVQEEFDVGAYIVGQFCEEYLGFLVGQGSHRGRF